MLVLGVERVSNSVGKVRLCGGDIIGNIADFGKGSKEENSGNFRVLKLVGVESKVCGC